MPFFDAAFDQRTPQEIDAAWPDKPDPSWRWAWVLPVDWTYPVLCRMEDGTGYRNGDGSAEFDQPFADANLDARYHVAEGPPDPPWGMGPEVLRLPRLKGGNNWSMKVDRTPPGIGWLRDESPE